MSDSNSESSVSHIVSLLKSSMSVEGSQAFGYLVIYTSFGVVRGRTSFSFEQSGDNTDSAVVSEMIELHNVSVEHYSNHLPSAAFERFYVRLSDINGFAIFDSQS